MHHSHISITIQFNFSEWQVPILLMQETAVVLSINTLTCLPETISTNDCKPSRNDLSHICGKLLDCSSLTTSLTLTSQRAPFLLYISCNKILSTSQISLRPLLAPGGIFSRTVGNVVYQFKANVRLQTLASKRYFIFALIELK